WAVPEVRNQSHWEAKRSLDRHPQLRELPWSADVYTRELNAGEQRQFFKEAPAPNDVPIIQGEQFNIWGVRQGALPSLWVSLDEVGAGGFLRGRQIGRIYKWIDEQLAAHGRAPGGSSQEERACKWLESVTGRPEVP